MAANRGGGGGTSGGGGSGGSSKRVVRCKGKGDNGVREKDQPGNESKVVVLLLIQEQYLPVLQRLHQPLCQRKQRKRAKPFLLIMMMMMATTPFPFLLLQDQTFFTPPLPPLSPPHLPLPQYS